MRRRRSKGSAKAKRSQAELVETSRACDLARTARADGGEGPRRWFPLTGARWTLIDDFEHGGHRYVVARENQPSVSGLAALSDRERQVVACLAIGQSTKETAYALGISDATVRVLVGRAAAKLGVRTGAACSRTPRSARSCRSVCDGARAS